MIMKTFNSFNFPPVGTTCCNTAGIVGLINVLRLVWGVAFTRSTGRKKANCAVVKYSCKNTCCTGSFVYESKEGEDECKIISSSPCTCEREYILRGYQLTWCEAINGYMPDDIRDIKWDSHTAWKKAIICKYLFVDQLDIVDAQVVKNKCNSQWATGKHTTSLMCKSSDGHWEEAWAKRVSLKKVVYFQIEEEGFSCRPPGQTDTETDIICPSIIKKNKNTEHSPSMEWTCTLCCTDYTKGCQYRLDCGCKNSSPGMCHDCLFQHIGSRQSQSMERGECIVEVRKLHTINCPFCNVECKKFRSSHGDWTMCPINYGWFYERPILHHTEFKKYETFFIETYLPQCVNAQSAIYEAEAAQWPVQKLRREIEDESKVLASSSKEPSILTGPQRRLAGLEEALEYATTVAQEAVKNLPAFLTDRTGLKTDFDEEKYELWKSSREVTYKQRREAEVSNRNGRAAGREDADPDYALTLSSDSDDSEVSNRNRRAAGREDADPDYVLTLSSDSDDSDDESL